MVWIKNWISEDVKSKIHHQILITLNLLNQSKNIWRDCCGQFLAIFGDFLPANFFKCCPNDDIFRERTPRWLLQDVPRLLIFFSFKSNFLRTLKKMAYIDHFVAVCTSPPPSLCKQFRKLLLHNYFSLLTSEKSSRIMIMTFFFCILLHFPNV